jgi:hypothetical protein
LQVANRCRCLQVYKAILASLDASPDAHVLLHRSEEPRREGSSPRKKALFFVPPSSQEPKGEEKGFEILYCNASFCRLASLIRATSESQYSANVIKLVKA